MLHVRGVRKSYGDVVALDGADLDVGEGEICGLLGPNGAGKTTLVAVATAYALCLLALGGVMLAVCRTVMQLNGITNLGAMLLAGIGGALAPVADLPGWARAVAPVTPSYWAMRGFRDVIVHGEGLGAVGLPIAVLLASATALAALTLWRFKFEETKLNWA